ncbi:MAG: AMP-binding protein [Miltoncostaeaceae bacterium]
MSTPAPAAPLGVPFAARLAAHGERPALIHGDAVLTYAELARRVETRRGELGAGRRLVAIEGSDHPETVISHLAVLAGGHVGWLLPSVADSAELLERFAPDTLVRAAGDGVAIGRRHEEPVHDLHPELALLMGTSGSTGAPRLVRLSHENLQSNAESIGAYLGLRPGERAITTLPMHYCYGLSVLHSHLAAGACVVLNGHSVVEPAFWELVRAHRVTGFAGVPHTFGLLERAGFADMHLPSLRYLTQAGGRMEPARVRRLAELGARRGWELVVMYGQTEATARMAYLPPSLASAHPDSIGVAIPGGELTLRQADDHPDPEVGELVYRGPNVMLGYAETAGDLAGGRTVRELATGDLARRTPEGLFVIAGRRSRFIKPFGLRVDLARVEAMLAAEGVEAVCAGDDTRLAVAVTGGACPAATGMLLADRLGLPNRAIEVRHHESIPRLVNGKPDYRAVAGAGREETVGRTGAPGLLARAGARLHASRPRDVAALYAAALGRDVVGPGDTFTRLGGDSLTYVDVSLGLEGILGDLPDGWPDMPVGELQARAGAGAGSGHRAWTTRMETGVVLRAAAILLVLATHMTDVIPPGGAHLLLALAGWNFARFMLSQEGTGAHLRRALGVVARIAVPAAAWIGAVMLVAGGYGITTLLLVNDYLGDPSFSDGRWHYWFIEALVQILLVAGLLMAVPAVRRAERARPFGFALALLAPALVLRFDLLTIGDPTRYIFRPHTVVWLFLLGWAAQRATDTRRRALVSALCLVSVPGFFGEPLREGIILAGLLAAIWLPAVRVPRPAAPALGAVAAASLAIYLTHWQVWPALPASWPVPVLMLACVVAGIVAWAATERVTRLIARGVTLAQGGSRGSARRRAGRAAQAAAGR